MLDSTLLQTGLLIVAPFLLPSALKRVQSFLYPSPQGATITKRTTQRAERCKDGRNLASFRLFIVTLGGSIALFTALLPPHNLFLSLSQPHSFLSRLFPPLRYPLDLRLAPETLQRLWVSSLRRPLSSSELFLIQRLQTLDARLGYVAYGSGPILNCSWCKPFSSSTQGGVGGDHLVSILPGLMIVWISVLAAMGLLLSGNGREKWRGWAVAAVGAAVGNEVWKRLTWEGLRPGALSNGQTVSMLHSQLHLQRSLLSALFLLIAYFAPASPSIPSDPSSFRASTSSIVTPAIRGLVEQSEEVLEKLRCLSIERMAILHHDRYRSKVNSFWEEASRESQLARADPTVQALLDKSRESDAAKEFDKFVEKSFRIGRGRGAAEERKAIDAESEREVEEDGDGGMDGEDIEDDKAESPGPERIEEDAVKLET